MGMLVVYTTSPPDTAPGSPTPTYSTWAGSAPPAAITARESSASVAAKASGP